MITPSAGWFNPEDTDVPSGAFRSLPEGEHLLTAEVTGCRSTSTRGRFISSVWVANLKGSCTNLHWWVGSWG